MKDRFLKEVMSTIITRCFVTGYTCKFLYKKRWCMFHPKLPVDIDMLRFSACPAKEKREEVVII